MDVNEKIITSSTVQGNVSYSNENENNEIGEGEEQLCEELKQEIITEMIYNDAEDLKQYTKKQLSYSIIFLVICIIMFFSTAVCVACCSR